MNLWTERILDRAVKALVKQGKTVDEAVDTLIGVPKEVIDKNTLKEKIKAKN